MSALADLYRVRALARPAVRRHDLSMVERSIRREVAQRVLDHQLPALVAELVDAATDDLSPTRSTDPEVLADVELRIIEAVERSKSVLDAVALEALARLQAGIEAAERARMDAIGGRRPAGWVSAGTLTTLEVATATGLGQQEVSVRTQLATSRSPGSVALRGRLREGTVSLHRACAVDAEIARLPQEAGPAIVESTLRAKDGAPPSPTLFRQRLTPACIAADREAAAPRRSARRRRGAHASLDSDGLGVLTVTNDADKIVAAMERAERLARAARQAGDVRDLDVLRADVITDLLVFGDATTTGRSAFGRPAAVAAQSGGVVDGLSPDVRPSSAGSIASGPPTGCRVNAPVGRRPAAHVTVVVPLSTALGVTDAPCEIPGHGWVSAEHARAIMLGDDATWRRLVVDAGTGRALALETAAYRPTAAMRRAVEAVDGTCRGPGCTVPAARCDLDHDTPWPLGRTAVDDLTCKHRTHHNLHTHAHWSVHRHPDGRLQWRTQAGRTYLTHPKDWLEAVREGPPGPLASPGPSSIRSAWSRCGRSGGRERATASRRTSSTHHRSDRQRGLRPRRAAPGPTPAARRRATVDNPPAGLRRRR